MKLETCSDIQLASVLQVCVTVHSRHHGNSKPNEVLQLDNVSWIGGYLVV